jgi:hypothetical protein
MPFLFFVRSNVYWPTGQTLQQKTHDVATHGGNPEKQDGSHEPECIHVLGLRVKTSARGKRTFFPDSV